MRYNITTRVNREVNSNLRVEQPALKNLEHAFYRQDAILVTQPPASKHSVISASQSTEVKAA